MTRLDVPTLQCDRCKMITIDKLEMVNFEKLDHCGQSDHKGWDLCSDCWLKFKEYFIPDVDFKVSENDNEIPI